METITFSLDTDKRKAIDEIALLLERDRDSQRRDRCLFASAAVAVRTY